MAIQINGAGTITGLDADGISAQPVFPGQVLQVVQATKTTTFSTTSTSFVDLTDLSASITPSSVSNKILVRYSVNCANTSNNNSVYLTLVRGSTQIFIGNGSGQGNPATSVGTNFGLGGSPEGVFTHNLSSEYLDSPSTTLATTYKIQMRVTAATGFVNRRGDSNADGTVSSITLMEIAG